uniref:Uncharacterized protein n=1 Tax=Molossus molossus TaxID=27622 RepID=A0A7J8C8S8_MOLMO|nr:hypothetical protein HJG59_009894 [Molossus molossus]
MDRQLALILGEPWAGAALASDPPVSVPAPSLPPLLLQTLPVSCLVWSVPSVAEDQGGERPVLPCDGCWGCDLGRGLCPALSGHVPLKCGELEEGIATSHQDAGFGVEVSHGLLLAKVCGGGVSPSTPPARNVK